jgi:hypothetical protein
LANWSGDTLLTNVRFDTNHATNRRGGGFYIRSGNVTLDHCVIIGNTSGDAGFDGGGYKPLSAPTLIAPQITNQSINEDPLGPE